MQLAKTQQTLETSTKATAQLAKTKHKVLGPYATCTAQLAKNIKTRSSTKFTMHLARHQDTFGTSTKFIMQLANEIH